MTQYRDHRRLLDESMETLVAVETRADLINHLREEWLGDEPDWERIEIKPYSGSDHRIGWAETWIVNLPGFGVLGFTDGPLPA